MVTYIDEAFAKKGIQYPFVVATMNNKITKKKKRQMKQSPDSKKYSE
jgi:hypothetical protein